VRNVGTHRSLAALFLALVLFTGRGFAGCDDPIPTNCPPPKPPCCESVGITPQLEIGGRVKRPEKSSTRGRAWLYLALRTLAGAVRAT